MIKIVAAFRGMHVSPAKHSYGSVTDGRTDDVQSDPYVLPHFAGDTKKGPGMHVVQAKANLDRWTNNGQSHSHVTLCFAGATKHKYL